MFRVLLIGLLAVSFGARAADADDGFIWIDANTKIKLLKAAAGASAPEKAAPKPEKKEKPGK